MNNCGCRTLAAFARQPVNPGWSLTGSAGFQKSTGAFFAFSTLTSHQDSVHRGRLLSSYCRVLAPAALKSHVDRYLRWWIKILFANGGTDPHGDAAEQCECRGEQEDHADTARVSGAQHGD